jgi:hypothetical protein
LYVHQIVREKPGIRLFSDVMNAKEDCLFVTTLKSVVEGGREASSHALGSIDLGANGHLPRRNLALDWKPARPRTVRGVKRSARHGFAVILASSPQR